MKFLMTCINCLEQTVLAVCKAALVLYRYTLSPLLGNTCRFWPSCSEYALEQLNVRPRFSSLGLIMRRLMRCHPFHPGGIDKVRP